MNIHLIKTPGYDPGNFQEVFDLLSSFNGPLKFIAGKYEFNRDQFSFLQNFHAYQSDNQKAREVSLTWEELFSRCNFYRKKFRIAKRDFVVLLTEQKNALNWFSQCDENKNIFVHTADLEYFVKAPREFPIAYQVVENVMRHLMKIDTENVPNPHIHEEPLGCMNDFCQNKRQIILKLRTADICHDCLIKMEGENVDYETINQAITVFEDIRKRVLFIQGFRGRMFPEPLNIEADGEVLIGGKKIKLDALPKTLFVFFLQHKEGISLNDLKKYKEELFRIYRALRKSAKESTIDDIVRPYYQDTTFPKNKSVLNKKLKKQLGEDLANFYYLNGNRGETFSISISHIKPEFVSIDLRY